MLKTLKHKLLGDPSRLMVKAPEPDANRRGIAVAAIVQNEAGRIADWLRFQAICGVRTVFLYDNASTDQTVEIAEQFKALDVRIIPWAIDVRISKSKLALRPQPLAYAHAVCSFGAHYRWMTFLDIDEYIVPVHATSIEESLSTLPPHPNISLPWTMFGFDGHKEPPDLPPPLAFERKSAKKSGPLLNYKCILDPCDVTQIQVHKHETASKGTESINDRGVAAKNYKARLVETFATTDALQLNHYYTMSQSEMETKISKGAVSGISNDERANRVRSIAAEIEEQTIPDEVARRFLERNGYSDAESYRRIV